jgi:hypothetical protein
MKMSGGSRRNRSPLNSASSYLIAREATAERHRTRPRRARSSAYARPTETSSGRCGA